MTKNIKGIKIINNSVNSTEIRLTDNMWLSNLKHGATVKNIEVKIALFFNKTAKYNVMRDQVVIDQLIFNNSKVAYLTLTDIIIDALTNSKALHISLAGLATADVDATGSGINVEYNYSSDTTNHAVIARSIGGADINIDLGDGSMSGEIALVQQKIGKKHVNLAKVVNSKIERQQNVYLNNKIIYLPSYNCEDSVKLNMQQYIVKETTDDALNAQKFYYVGANGCLDEFSDKYYYLSKDNTKQYVQKDKVELQFDGSLIYQEGNKIYKVLKEQKTDSGLKLIDDMDGFKNSKYFKAQSQEEAQLKEEVNAMTQTIKDCDNSLKQIEDSFTRLSASFQDIITLENSRQSLLDNKKALINQKKEFDKNYNAQRENDSLRKQINEQQLSDHAFHKAVNSNNRFIGYKFYDAIQTKCLENKTSEDWSKCKYHTLSIGLSITDDMPDILKKCVCQHSSAVMCLHRVQTFMSYLEQNKNHELNYTKSFNANGHDYSGAAAAQQEIAKMQYPSEAKAYYDSATGNVAILGINLNTEFCNMASKEYFTDYLYQLFGMSLQYDSILKELEQIDKRLDYYKAKNKSYAQAKADYDAFVASYNGIDKLEVISNYHNTVYMDFVSVAEQKSTLIKQKSEATERLEKSNLMLETYKYTTPSIFLSGGGQHMGFTPIKGYNDVFALTDIVDAYKNAIHISYFDNKIIAIGDGEKDYIKLTYDKTGLIEIKTDAGDVVSFKDGCMYKNQTLINKISISNSKLSSIANAYDKRMDFGFDYPSGKCKYIIEADKSYYISSDKILTHDPQGHTQIKIEYESSRTANVSTYAWDQYHVNWKQMQSEVYQFDGMGRVVAKFKTDENFKPIEEGITFDYSGHNVSFTALALPYGEEILQNTEQYHGQVINLGGTNANIFDIDVTVDRIKYHDYILSAVAYAPQAAYVCRDRVTAYGDKTIAHSDNCNPTRRFEMKATVRYKNNDVSEQYCSFDWQNNGKQYLALPVAIKESQIKNIQSMTVTIDYTDNIGVCKIENIKLREAQWEYKQYNGDLLEYEQNSLTDIETSYQYDKDDNLVLSTIEKSGVKYNTTYQYNLQGALVKSIDHDGMTRENVYGDNGELIKSLTYSQHAPASQLVDDNASDDSKNTADNINQLGEKFCEQQYDAKNRLSANLYANNQRVAFGYDKDGELNHITACVDGEVNENTKLYTQGYLTELRHNNTSFNFAYDNLGRILAVSVGGQELIKNIYEPLSYNQKSVYANGDTYLSVKNKDGQILTVSHKNSGDEYKTILENKYNKQGNITDIIDNSNHKAYNIKYIYDEHGRPNYIKAGGVAITDKYDSQGRIDKQTHSALNKQINYSYNYKSLISSDVESININGKTQKIKRDYLNRLTAIDNAGAYATKWSYLQNGERATEQVSQMEYIQRGKTTARLRYVYDKLGNIEQVLQNGKLINRYAYDGISRLVREDNKKLNVSIIYAYDAGGNIVQKSVYNYTLTQNIEDLEPIEVIPYSYNTNGINDQLTGFGRASIEYDAIGNPTTYRDIALKWKYTRQLESFGNIANYNYLADGTRIEKITNQGATTYHSVGGKLIAEELQGRTIIYTYGADGVNGIIVNGKQYYYLKNLQGDVQQILDSAGDTVAEYIYDAFGRHQTYAVYGDKKILLSDIDNIYRAENATISLSDIPSQFPFGLTRIGEQNADANNVFNLPHKTSSAKQREGAIDLINHIGIINPIRYRGYYYDTETSLYYLQTRYYDPQVGRFINADDISYLDPENINGLNLYAYCANNPIMAIDPTGNMPKWLKWLGIGAAMLGAVLVIGAITVLTAGVGTTVLAGTLAGAVIHGAAVGALIGAGVGVVAGGIIGGATTGWSAEGILIGMGIGFGGGALIGAVIGGAVGGVQFGTFASKASLNTHLTKHGTKMGYNSAKQYASGAKYVIKNGTKVSYTYKGKLTTGYVRFLGQGGGANYAFVGMNGSRVATFGIRGVSELIKMGIPWLL